jgi:hypothetical protein
MLAGGERIQTSVGGDAVEPCAERSSREAVEAVPGTQIGLLHEIIRFVQGAKHAVAMQFDFPAERFGEPFKRLVCVL